MNKFFWRCLLAATVWTVLLPCLPQSAAAAPSPTEQMRPFVDKVVAQLKQPDFKSDSTKNKIQRIVAVVSEQFDFKEMSKRVVGPPWKTMPPAEQDQFAALFSQLLGHVYIDKVDDYVDKKIEFGKEHVKGDRAEVKTAFVDSAKSIPVSYVMILKGNKWMTYDVLVEGVSLVRNYMEQFKGMARDRLIPVLEEKIKELETKTPASTSAAGAEPSKP